MKAHLQIWISLAGVLYVFWPLSLHLVESHRKYIWYTANMKCLIAWKKYTEKMNGAMQWREYIVTYWVMESYDYTSLLIIILLGKYAEWSYSKSWSSNAGSRSFWSCIFFCSREQVKTPLRWVMDLFISVSSFYFAVRLSVLQVTSPNKVTVRLCR
jgi:hypothetical protein